MLDRIRNRIAQIMGTKGDRDHYGNRRAECWWEPIYNPTLQGELELSEWCFDGTAGPSKKFFSGGGLVSATSKGVLHTIKSITFIDCDFQGSFDPETIVMFHDCKFIRCDFAYSYWRDTHFRECRFESSSFSLASFSRCQFRDNEWRLMGFSGSKTEILQCHFTNPTDFIRAGFSGHEPGNESREHGSYQWYRLQGTKAHLARTLLASHESTGDDATFYETAKVHDLQQSFAVIAKNIYNLVFAKESGRVRAFVGLLFALSENLLLRFFGLLNGWGASILKPLAALGVLFCAFSVLYRYSMSIDWYNSLQKSFNITILAGYSNEYHRGMIVKLAVLQDFHALISIVMYSVFFGTIISKLSRVR